VFAIKSNFVNRRH